MKKSVGNKIVGYVLTVALIAGSLSLSPLGIVEAKAAATVKNVNLNVDGNIAGLVKGQDDKGSKIYFGSKDTPLLWRMISTDKTAVPARGVVTLLADGSVGNQAFDDGSHLWSGTDSSDHADDADLCKWLNDDFLQGRFTDLERNPSIMQASYKDINESEYGRGDVQFQITPNQTIVVPSVEEVIGADYETSEGAADGANGWFSGREARKLKLSSGDKGYWLRTPGWYSSGMACAVLNTGYVDYDGTTIDNYPDDVRPVFKLNLSSVLFTSNASAGKGEFNIVDNASTDEI